MAKKRLISPTVNFYETDKSDVKSYFAKSPRGAAGTSGKSTTTSGKAIIITNFLLQENGFYLLQEDGSNLLF